MNQTHKNTTKPYFTNLIFSYIKKEIQNYKDGTIKIWTVHLLQEHTIVALSNKDVFS